MRRTGTGLLLLTIAWLTACSGSDAVSSTQGRTLQLSLTGLPALANGFHYEGWAILNGVPVSTGTFNIGSGGGLVTTAGASIPSGRFTTQTVISSASAIVLTIEPGHDTDPGPSSTHVLAGAVSGRKATLSVGAPQALGSDFSSATGKFILATPTDGMGTNEKSGLWFLDPAGGPGPGLALPTLPAGWTYEGWAVVGSVPLTTGKFLSPRGADMSAPFSSTMPGPPFPGEDFLRNAPAGVSFPLDLSGQMAVITIEPDPDDAATPFGLKPLVGAIPQGAKDHTAYGMTNQAAALPSGTAEIL